MSDEISETPNPFENKPQAATDAGARLKEAPVPVKPEETVRAKEAKKKYARKVVFDAPNVGHEQTRPKLPHIEQLRPNIDISFVGQGRLRKIAIIGSSTTAGHAPWGDPTWEIWSHASARFECARHNVQPSRFFDLHPRELWNKEKAWDPEYRKWLGRNKVPIFMQAKWAEVPASVRFPKENLLAEFGADGFSNHVAWMIALAMREGVTHIGIFGCDYMGTIERDLQRPGATYWAGFARGRGVQIVVSPKSMLLQPPGGMLYGYQSHTEHGLVRAYRAPVRQGDRKAKVIKAIVFDMKDIEKPRPALRQDLDEPPDWARGGHPLPRQQGDGSWKYY